MAYYVKNKTHKGGRGLLRFREMTELVHEADALWDHLSHLFLSKQGAQCKGQFVKRNSVSPMLGSCSLSSSHTNSLLKQNTTMTHSKDIICPWLFPKNVQHLDLQTLPPLSHSSRLTSKQNSPSVGDRLFTEAQWPTKQYETLLGCFTTIALFTGIHSLKEILYSTEKQTQERGSPKLSFYSSICWPEVWFNGSLNHESMLQCSTCQSTRQFDRCLMWNNK